MKSSNSIDTSITDFIDIPEDNEIFSLTSSNVDHAIKDDIGW